MGLQEEITRSQLGIHEQLLLDIFDRQAPLQVLDIGAHICSSSLRYAYLFPNCIINAFEPLPKNVEACEKNIADFKKDNIRVHPYCLADAEGTAAFHVSGWSQDALSAEAPASSSLLAPHKATAVFPFLKFEEQCNVTTKTLHSVLEILAIDAVDFVHLDVQGAELKVLKGAGSYLQTFKTIWLEVSNISFYDNQPLKRDVQQFLTAHHFVKLLDTVTEVLGDQFWIHRSLYDSIKGRESLRKLEAMNRWMFPYNRFRYKIKYLGRKLLGRYN